DDDDAGQNGDAADHSRHAVVEELVDAADVVLDPAHQRADAAPVDVADAERLQMTEHPVPQVEHDPVAEPGDDIKFTPGGEEAHHEGDQEGDAQQVDD